MRAKHWTIGHKAQQRESNRVVEYGDTLGVGSKTTNVCIFINTYVLLS